MHHSVNPRASDFHRIQYNSEMLYLPLVLLENGDNNNILLVSFACPLYFLLAGLFIINLQ